MKQKIRQRGLRALLGPVARYCLRHGFKLQDVIEELKPVFVEHSQRQLDASAQGSSVSRISLMSGVHRKDVTRLVASNVSSGSEESEASSRNIIWKILNAWETSPEFQTSAGKPRVLSEKSASQGFAELVAQVSREVNPYSVSLELQRMGVVQKTSKGLKLVHAEYQTSDNYQEALNLLSADIDDLVQTVEENVFSTPHGLNHHVKTQFDEIPASAVPELRAWLNSVGRELHAQLRAKFSATEAAPSKDSEKLVRVAFLSAVRFDSNLEDYFFKA